MSDREYLQKMCEEVDKHLPDGHGFILFAFPFENQGDNMLRYASNANRETAVAALKEWLFQMGEGENWMKHLDEED